MPRLISAEEIAGLLRPGMKVYIAGLAGESNLFAETLAKSPKSCAGIRFVGVWLPGFNRTDYAALHPDARALAFFVGSELRSSFAAGAIDFVPISYFNIFTYLSSCTIDLAFLHVSAPDANGSVSLGVANDFTPAILSRAATKVAHINPQMPRTIGASTLDPLRGGTPEGSSLGVGAGLRDVGCALIAGFAGAWVAGRLAGMPDRTDGMLHGLVTWGLSMLLLIYLLTTAVSTAVRM